MKSIFNNANVKITPHKMMENRTLPSNGFMDIVREAKEEAEAEEMMKKIDKDEKDTKKSESKDDVASASLSEAFFLNLTNRLYEDGLSLVFKEIVSDIYLEALYLDDDFKKANINSIKETAYSFIDNNGGFKMLEEAYAKTKSPLLKKMKSTVEACARKSAKRKVDDVREACSGPDKGSKCAAAMQTKYSFDLNSKEYNEYVKARDNLSTDEIVDLVKNKVLDVIEDEGKRKREDEHLDQELTEKVSAQTDDPEKQEKLKEAALSALRGNAKSKMTLFEAIQANSMKEMITAIKGNGSSTNHTRDTSSGIENDMKKEKDKDPNGNSSTTEATDNTTIEEPGSNNKDNKKNKTGEVAPIGDSDVPTEESIDMDMVLAESIAKYTLLETVSTLRLESYNRAEIEDMCLDLTR